ncbi:type II toxin-antitoxin system RelE/ParE family toxin [Mesorhizobium sp. SB112]|uniref:type II toxin-antitoxin system RelE/ParE family toxin n=1 Tax=Mesorhizobium sp. SB112 TaxID=3151853 RepID=UPI0032665C25
MTKFTPSAAAFVRKERDYLSGNSRSAARRFAEDISSVVRLLDEYPLAGSQFELFKTTSFEGIRRWVKGNYRFDYEIDRNGEAVILLVRHHAQDDPFAVYEPDDNEDFDP